MPAVKYLETDERREAQRAAQRRCHQCGDSLKRLEMMVAYLRRVG